MNYQIIKDESLLLDFIDWLPELNKNETYYICLFARSKYQDKNSLNPISHISSDKAQLKRVTATKDRIIHKIRQMECTLGSYVQFKGNGNHIPIPQETLALYITPNPRCYRKAMLGSLKKFADLICNGDNIINPNSFSMSEIQRSKSRTEYVDFDFDDVDYDNIADDIESILHPDCYSVLKTRGGVHVLVKPTEATKHNKKWYYELKELPNVDQTGDCMIPVVGCTQGDFVPKFLKI